MTTNMDWQGEVGRNWAQMHRLTDRSFAGLTQVLLDRISAISAMAVLDIGCGAGELSLAIARERPEARVIGMDISAELVEVARSRAEHLGNAAFAQGDAALWHEASFAPDLLVSRHGVMFFADPVAAFGHLRAMARPEAHLLFSCFRSPAENGWVPDLRVLFPDDPPPPAANPRDPGPFAFADSGYVADILRQAGWNHIAFDPVDFAYVAGTGPEAEEDAARFFTRIGPAANAMRSRPQSDLARAMPRLRAWIERHSTQGLVAFPAAAWIVSARA